jgi:hypothetical protein
MKNIKQHNLLLEVFMMAKNNQQTKKQTVQTTAEKRAGYGDKKLEGPNRPAD